MKTSIKCYRCGKEYPLTYKSIHQTVHCSHCHLTMTLDPQSVRKLKTVRYIFVAVIVLGLMYSMTHFTTIEDFAIFVFVVGVAITISMFADQMCLWIAANLFELNYVEYHAPDKRELKNRKKNKK